jgi:hypothetical protein
MKKPSDGSRVWLIWGLISILFGGWNVGYAATLVWNPNPAGDGVIHYTVYVDSALGSTQMNVSGTSFPLDQLTPGISYTLRVTATSDAGIESPPASIQFFASAQPQVTLQPASKPVAIGDPLELLVEVSGSPPFYFQWMHNGTALPTQTNQSLLITSATTANAGLYSVQISNAVSSVISSGATVTILDRPTILTQPVARTVAAGAPFQLSVTAGGSNPLSYQWFRDSQPIPGAQSASYEVGSAISAHAGTYFVQVANAVGSAQSVSVTVVVQAAPSIIAHPQSITVSQGSQIALAVVAVGSPPVTYQWYKGSVPLTGRTASTLVISNASVSDDGTYTVRVSNQYGEIESNPANVTVQTASILPTIITQPRAVTVAVGSPVTLDVLASGTTPLQYQWFKNGTNLPGRTDSTLSILAAAVNDTGSYTVVVSNSVGTVTSAPGLVTVLVPPSIITQPGGTSVAAGGTVVLSVSATGSLPLTYQWYRSGQLIAGAVQSILTIPSAQTGDSGGYQVIVSNGGGSASSMLATVTVVPPSGTPPTIIDHPQDIAVNEGDPVELAVEAQGEGPFQYVWFKNGQPLSDKTNAVLTIGVTAKTDEAIYTVRVSNRYGFVQSNPANLGVRIVPKILWHPQSIAVRAGNSFQLTVGASSLEPMTYQWIKDDIEIPGATAPNYNVVSAQTDHVGVYRVKISNNSGFVLSRQAIVTIAFAPQIFQQPTGITVNEGATLRLSFLVSGTGPFVVEWLRDNVLVQVTNVTQLAIADAKVSDEGNYVARVTGPGGSTATLPVAVRIEAKPVITSQPQSANVLIGANLTLTVSAIGNGTLAYQWLKDGQPIPGAQNIFLTVFVRSQSDFGRYSVRVSNAAGFTESAPAIIQSLVAPTILTQPENIDVLIGTPFALAVEISGAFPYTFQWFRNGVGLNGSNAPALNVSAASSNHAGVYHVVVSNVIGSARSANATVRVIPHIAITQSPTNRNVPFGSGLTLSVQASSDLPLAYQWFRDGEELEGQTGPSLQITAVTDADEGVYHVLVRNDLEEVPSSSAEVNVTANPDIFAGRLTITASVSGAQLVGQGEPGATYDVQLTGDLSNQNWITIQTVVADAAGRLEIRAPSSGRYWFIRTSRQ